MKRNSDSSLDCFKARFVAQGYTQTRGIDYEEVFTPVAKYFTIRTLLTFSNAHDLEVHQLDVKTAFLNGFVEHDIYMSQPEGFIDPNRPNYVCKQDAGTAHWMNFSLHQAIERSAADECIYIKQIKNSNGKISFVILAVYVDDMLPVSNNIDFLNAKKKSLCDHFEMTDQGEVHYILGMSIKRDRQNCTMYISQQNYVEGILKCFGMEDCKPISTPIKNCVKFHKLSDEDEPFDTQIYQQAIGCFTYLSTATHPDIY